MLRSSALSHLAAGLLLAVLTLAGVARTLAAAPDGAPRFGPPGIAVTICHTSPGHAGPDPADPARHSCCDDCILSALVTLADGPALTRPTPVGHVLSRGQAVAWVPVLARRRTPRQSQGPPGA